MYPQFGLEWAQDGFLEYLMRFLFGVDHGWDSMFLDKFVKCRFFTQRYKQYVLSLLKLFSEEIRERLFRKVKFL